LATIQILADSRVTLETAERPRFGLDENPFKIYLIDAFGRLEVTISPDLSRDLHMRIKGEGYTIQLDHSGYYLIEFGTDTVRVEVKRGEALIIGEGNRTKLVTTGEIATATQGNLLEVTSANQDILVNSLFQDGHGSLPLGWGCDRGEQDRPDDPPGQRERVFFQDRYALRIWRLSDQQLFEARTGCEQRNVDVSQYSSLKLRVSFYLVSQSLSGCGQLGTECPLILQMTYTAADGNTYVWLQGFYIFWNAGVGRIRCDTCTQDHQQVNAEAWHTFESEDFILDLPTDRANQRPVRIDKIRFYASGHEYEVYVGELSLISQTAPN
jgi:hypothetical protein